MFTNRTMAEPQLCIPGFSTWVCVAIRRHSQIGLDIGFEVGRVKACSKQERSVDLEHNERSRRMI
jgi:hypothetical protein